MKKIVSAGALALLSGAMPGAALAHPGHGAGLVAGFLHPLTGADHLLAMLAVGLWAAILGGRALWALPSAFVAALALGGVLGAIGIGGAGVEDGVLASVLILGAAAALALRLPMGLAVAGVAGFGLLHGLAHGAEVTGPLAPYALGFIVASVLLHLAGLALGRSAGLARFMGAGVALGGLALAFA